MRETEPLRPGHARRVPSSLPGDGFAEPRLADTAVIEPDSTPGSYREPQLFASSIEPETRRPGGLALWFVAAFCLVVGIGIGFASGYRVARGGSLFDLADLTGPAPQGSTSQGSTPQEPTRPKSASESSVGGPVRLESEQIVPSPETPAPPPIQKPAEPAPQRRVAEPAPQRQPSRQSQSQARPAGPSSPTQAAPASSAQAAPPKPAEPPAAATGPGLLQVLSRPAGAQVFLDGRLVGKTPLSLPSVEPGPHSVRLELAGFNGWSTTVDIKGGESVRVAASLEQP